MADKPARLFGVSCDSRGREAYKYFDGADYDHQHDAARLTGQIRAVYDFIRDGKWHSLGEIAESTREPEASVSAQLRNLRKTRFGGHTILRRRRGEPRHGLFEYRLQTTPGR